MTSNTDKQSRTAPAFCHQKEMKNFSTYLYLRHHQVVDADINNTYGDPIAAISPKVLSLLLLAEEAILLKPIAAHPEVGIVLELSTPFGQACVYSKIKGGWASEETGSTYLGFSTSFSGISPEQLERLKISSPGFELVADPQSSVANLASGFRIEPWQCTLGDVHEVFVRWLNLFMKAHEMVSPLPTTEVTDSIVIQ
ncbi:hypothetical protein QWY20_17545 [Alkalimonas sp. MEB108]|uniref:Uncharacterized protein n=1 Tax=Alkalimonas cellulosilytica TaxID=3058395 RepID=A0ABU7JBJ2_9GAMM|nr:hypothetical protein [Alkalimonas sp. MEB108]MEE2003260.1 hypothetical protein [Alkalimonas sp. MEB108]